MNIENMYLFRGISIESGGWVYGDLKNLSDGTRYIWGSFKEEVIPETVGQWTGLLDVNGVKIFEGDIIRHVAGNIFHTGSHVFMKYGSYKANCKHGDIGFGSFSKKVLIVSSVHDNLLVKNNTEVVK
jgi:hypothetical protein